MVNRLRVLENESLHILREAAGAFERPALLYSVGKDSSVLLHLARKAFAPGQLPFPLVHVDTGFKFGEMLAFRDRIARELGLRLIVHQNTAAKAAGVNPFRDGTRACCAQLKTQALLDCIREHRFDAVIGGARRDEERSRAKERIFSWREASGRWDPRHQRPELWSCYNPRLGPGEHMRVFPLSNWTEIEIWEYIAAEKIEVVQLYFARRRKMIARDGQLIPIEHLPAEGATSLSVEAGQPVVSRFRTLGCTYCTGAVRSEARSVADVRVELRAARRSERENRLIDHDQDGSMEIKKSEGYF